ncbi:MAG: GNAT family N-acetyltransferase [Candidatus Thermoplasmatota archaeon]|nr:GNAT family N-acetyltransferase [Candidatus Thermoplasmatota archaeon]
MKKSKKPSSPLIIRDFTLRDYREVIRVWDESDLSYRPRGRDSRQRIRWQLQQPNVLYLVAEHENKIIGTLFGTHDSRKGWINRLAVSPAYQHKGIARQLVTELESRLSQRGIEIIACQVEDWNTDSMQVFKKLGFKENPDLITFSKRKHPHV